MRSQDRLCGLKAPFGWEKDPDRPKYVRLCPVEAEICRKVYKLRDAGLSYREISDVLEDYGHVNRLGNKFGKESIRKIYISKKTSTDRMINIESERQQFNLIEKKRTKIGMTKVELC